MHLFTSNAYQAGNAVYCRSGRSQERTKGLRAQTATCSVPRGKKDHPLSMGFSASLVPQDWPCLNINNVWRPEYSVHSAMHLIRLLDTHGLLGHPAAFWSRKAIQQRKCKQRILCNWIVALSSVTNRNQSPVPCTGSSLSSASEIPRTPIWAITVSHESFSGVIFSNLLILFLKRY